MLLLVVQVLFLVFCAVATLPWDCMAKPCAQLVEKRLPSAARLTRRSQTIHPLPIDLDVPDDRKRPNNLDS